ncbi:hypothetical protein [Embleya scabrispora]|nr:hypothetical protein [Embleya scabrispora]
MITAEHGVWTGAYARRLFHERAGATVSAASVSALFTAQFS